MALYILQPGLQPVGQFDFLDTDLGNIVGGELGTLDEASRTVTSTEKAAQDALDGYVADTVDTGTAGATRAILRLADEATETYKVFYLLDDGTTGYGTLFGSLIGNPVGLTVTGTALGPHTAQGSGKVTAWGNPGLYAVSNDALSDLLDWTTGNLNDTPLPGTLLYREASTGLMTTDTTTSDEVAVFVELRGNGSLVTSPAGLVGATEAYDRMVIQYLGATQATKA